MPVIQTVSCCYEIHYLVLSFDPKRLNDGAWTHLSMKLDLYREIHKKRLKNVNPRHWSAY